jgi:general secretion pathway protein G
MEIIAKLRKINITVSLLMVVLAVGVLVPSVCESSSKISRTLAYIGLLEEALLNFEKDVKRLPTKEEGLDALIAPRNPIIGWHGPYLKRTLPPDSWGHDFKYIIPPIYGNKKFDLYSVGANGIDEHGNGDDVSNWKEYDKKYYQDTRLWPRMIFIVFEFLILFLIIAYIARKKPWRVIRKFKMDTPKR